MSNVQQAPMDHYGAEFQVFQDQQLATPSWLRQLRAAGFEQFQAMGFPTTRDEEWRFTSVRSLATQRFTVADPLLVDTAAAARQRDLLDGDHHRLVSFNGELQAGHSTSRTMTPAVKLCSLRELLRQDDRDARTLLASVAHEDSPFVSLNQAFIADGVVLRIPDGVKLQQPIELLFVSRAADFPGMSHPRIFVMLGRDSQATLVERHVGLEGAKYFSNIVSHIRLAPGAVLDHHKLQQEQRNAVHFACTDVELSERSSFRSHYFGFGGALARNEINCRLLGEHAECVLNGVYLARDRQHLDQRTRIDHAMPRCTSHELYKGILQDQAHGVFNGKIYVHADAQKTDAKQSNHVLLLSDDAVINTKPQLEIYADDVKCTHGATIGDLDEQALHYLRSRGLPLELARSLLIYAFANEIVREVSLPGVRRYLEEILLRDQGLDRWEESV